MTLIGTWIEFDRAWIWANSEAYRRSLGGEDEIYWRPDDPDRHLAGHPLGHHLKIAINKNAGFAAVGMGESVGNRRIAEALAFAVSFDEFADGLPRYLMGYAEDRVEYWGVWPRWTCAAVGWSRRFNRIVGAVFDYQTRFTPAYTSFGFSRPQAREFDTLQPTVPSDILGYAQQQMRLVQQRSPLAGEGIVTIAQLDRGGVSVTAFDIVTGRQADGFPDLPPMSSADFAKGVPALGAPLEIPCGSRDGPCTGGWGRAGVETPPARLSGLAP